MLVYKERGGIFLDRQPADIVREGLQNCLGSAGVLATNHDSADLVMSVYLFHFGLASSSGMDIFGKVELAVTLKNPKTGESKQVKASGTSIAGTAILKKNIQRNVRENIQAALSDGLRNLLRGTAFREAVLTLARPAAPATSPAPPAANPPSTTNGHQVR